MHNGADAKQMFEETGCDAVMIGRAAMGNPFLFAQIAQYLRRRQRGARTNFRRQNQTALWHARELTVLKGEHTAMNEMRRHAAWYTKGMPESARLRDRLCRVSSMTELEDILAEALRVAHQYEAIRETGDMLAGAAWN